MRLVALEIHPRAHCFSTIGLEVLCGRCLQPVGIHKVVIVALKRASPSVGDHIIMRIMCRM